MELERFPLDVFACDRCGHHQLGVVVDPELMFSNYAYASGTAASFRAHFTEYAKEIVERYKPLEHRLGELNAPPPSHFRVLEIGSNDSTMLKALLAAGASHVVGVEPAQNLAEKSSADGLLTVHSFFDAKVAVHPDVAPVDFWVANNVLAHVDDFVGTLNALALTGAKAGVFEVQYLGSLLDGGMFDMTYHEHLDYWRATELIEHLHGHTPWDVVDIEQVPTHGGSLRVWVERIDEGLRMRSGRVADFAERELKRDWAGAWHELKDKMNEERKRLHALLGDHKTVAIFGAPAKLTTLLYGLGLTYLNFAYAVDDSPLKQGLFTPGMGLEVSHPNRLLAEPVDAVLVGAWNFAPYIVPKLHDMLKGSANIVVPFEK